MKIIKAKILWITIGLVVVAGAGFLVFQYANPFYRPEVKQAEPRETQAISPETQSQGIASDCCGFPIFPLEKDFFDKKLPNYLKALANGPWPDWIRIEENELVFTASGRRVPYANKNFAVSHGDNMNAQSHTSGVEVPLLIPGNRGIALFYMLYFYEGVFYRLTIYDRTGRQLSYYDNYPAFPRFSPSGEYLLTTLVDNYDYTSDTLTAIWLSRLDGTAQFVAWDVDILACYHEQPWSTKEGAVCDVLISPDERHIAAILNGRNRAVILNLQGQPIGAVTTEFEFAEHPDVFWREAHDQLGKDAKVANLRPDTFDISAEEPVSPFHAFPAHIQRMSEGPLPSWVQVTDTRIAFSESGSELGYNSFAMRYGTGANIARVAIGLANGKVLALFQANPKTPKIDLWLLNQGGQIVARYGDLLYWPFIRPDGERILLLKQGQYVDWAPLGIWCIRPNGHLECFIRWEDVVRFTKEPQEFWDPCRGGVLPSHDWNHYFAFVNWGPEKGWRVAILSPEGRLQGKMSIGKGSVELRQGEMHVSEEALQAIEEYAAKLKE